MLTRRQQRDILALGLLALSLFVLLTLIPTSILGERGDRWFPSRNPMGIAGGEVRDFLVSGLGVGAALVPVLIFLGGLRAGDWLSPAAAARTTILLAGLLLLIPVTLHVAGSDPNAAGWLGEALGAPLAAILGWLGAIFLLVAALAILLVGTLGWNPVRVLLRSARWTWARGGTTLGALRRQFRSAVTSVAEKRTERRGIDDVAAGEDRDESRSEEDTGPDGPFPPPREDESSATAGVAGWPDPPEASGKEWGEEEVPPLDLLTRPRDEDRQGMERALDRLGGILIEKLQTFNVQEYDRRPDHRSGRHPVRGDPRARGEGQ